jgi:hypothetical protein
MLIPLTTMATTSAIIEETAQGCRTKTSEYRGSFALRHQQAAETIVTQMLKGACDKNSGSSRNGVKYGVKQN